MSLLGAWAPPGLQAGSLRLLQGHRGRLALQVDCLRATDKGWLWCGGKKGRLTVTSVTEVGTVSPSSYGRETDPSHHSQDLQ